MTANKTFSVRDIAYIGLMAALIAVCSWISIPLPGLIPFTLQTFAVCLAAALLGTKRGVVCVAVYILLGMVGLPVFSGFRGGIACIVGESGATGGYIVGFLFTALIVGAAKRLPGNRLVVGYLAMVLGVAVCYAFGTVWYMNIRHYSLAVALANCVVPFIVPDLVKLALADVLAVRLAGQLKL